MHCLPGSLFGDLPDVEGRAFRTTLFEHPRRRGADAFGKL
jgi:hypothetical protein